MDLKFKIGIVLILVFVWMGIIFNFSSMNTNKSNGKSVEVINSVMKKTFDITNKLSITNVDSKVKARELSQKLNPPLRKVAHASVYFILGILIVTFLRFLNVEKMYLYSVFFCFLYACSDEIHQRFVSGRTPSFKDVLIDTLGCIIGMGVYYFINKYLLNKAKGDVKVEEI